MFQNDSEGSGEEEFKVNDVSGGDNKRYATENLQKTMEPVKSKNNDSDQSEKESSGSPNSDEPQEQDDEPEEKDDNEPEEQDDEPEEEANSNDIDGKETEKSIAKKESESESDSDEEERKRRKRRRNKFSKKKKKSKKPAAKKKKGLKYLEIDDEDLVDEEDENLTFQKLQQHPVSEVASKIKGQQGPDRYYLYLEDPSRTRRFRRVNNKFLEKEKERLKEQTVTFPSQSEQKNFQDIANQIDNMISKFFEICRGLLAGVCLMQSFLTYLNFNDFVKNFFQWYSPLSVYIVKLYMILSQACVVCSGFQFVYRFRDSHISHKIRLVSNLVVYFLIFLLTLANSTLDDYFNYKYQDDSNFYEQEISGDLLSKFVSWQVINGFRTIITIISFFALTLLRTSDDSGLVSSSMIVQT